jgi:hypothetical protein
MSKQQETDYVNHVFMQQNPGFMFLYSFIKDQLARGASLRRDPLNLTCHSVVPAQNLPKLSAADNEKAHEK